MPLIKSTGHLFWPPTCVSAVHVVHRTRENPKIRFGFCSCRRSWNSTSELPIIHGTYQTGELSKRASLHAPVSRATPTLSINSISFNRGLSPLLWPHYVMHLPWTTEMDTPFGQLLQKKKVSPAKKTTNNNNTKGNFFQKTTLSLTLPCRVPQLLVLERFTMCTSPKIAISRAH